VNPADGRYVPLSDTLAEPSVVPPDVHDAGGAGCGPNTVKVSVPVGAEPPAIVAETDAADIGLPTVARAGAPAVRVGLEGAASSSRPWYLPELSM